MSFGEVLVMGGTSDARALCQQLDAANVAYTLSVATPTGKQLAGDIKGQVRCVRLEQDEMVNWLKENGTRWVIDASHPYAEVVSRNILCACERAGVLLSRYQRPEQLSELTHPLLFTVQSIAEQAPAVQLQIKAALYRYVRQIQGSVLRFFRQQALLFYKLGYRHCRCR